MTHALIVSSRGCGAREMVQQIARALNRPIAGYVTKREPALADDVSGEPIYLYEAGKSPEQSRQRLVGYCKNHHYWTVPRAFECCVPILTDPVPDNCVFIMAELGFMEASQKEFCQAVLDRLNGDIPVLAAVKDQDFVFLHTVRNHPKCKCFYLDRDNWEEIYQKVLSHMQRQFPQRGDYISCFSPELQPDTNREDLNYFLSLQEATFSGSSQYTEGKWNRRADFWEMERKLQRKSDERVDSTMDFLTRRGILTPGCRIADIGCGPGRFAAAFAQRGCHVVGFDLSPKMVAYGSQYLRDMGLDNAVLRCCDFSSLDIEKEGCKAAFDLVFSSLTPAVHNVEGLRKSMEMSRAWCVNISHIRRQNHLRERILREVFPCSTRRAEEGRAFYALFNTLFLLGYQPETSYLPRRKENRARPDEEYVEYIMEHALPTEEHTRENACRIQQWLLAHTEADGYLTEISDAVYGCILWDVRERTRRPDYRSVATGRRG